MNSKNDFIVRYVHFTQQKNQRNRKMISFLLKKYKDTQFNTELKKEIMIIQ